MKSHARGNVKLPLSILMLLTLFSASAVAQNELIFDALVNETPYFFSLKSEREEGDTIFLSGSCFQPPDAATIILLSGTIGHLVLPDTSEVITYRLKDQRSDAYFLLQMKERDGRPTQQLGFYYRSEADKSPLPFVIDLASIRVNGKRPTLERTPLPEQAIPPSEQLIPPSEQVIPQSEQVIPPSAQVIPPSEQVIPPSQQAIPPSEQVIPPSAQVIPPGEQVIPSTTAPTLAAPTPKAEPSAKSFIEYFFAYVSVEKLLAYAKQDQIFFPVLFALIGVLVKMALKARESGGFESSSEGFFGGVAGRLLSPILYGVVFYLYTTNVTLWDYRIAAVTAIILSIFVYRTFSQFPSRLSFKQVVFLNILFCAVLFFSFWFAYVGYTLARMASGALFNVDPDEYIFFCYAASGVVASIAFKQVTLLFAPGDTSHHPFSFANQALSLGFEQHVMSTRPLRFMGQALSLAFVPPVIGAIADAVMMAFVPQGIMLGTLANVVVGIGSVRGLGGLFYPKHLEEKHKEGRKVKTFKQAAKEAKEQRSSNDAGLYFGSRETAIPSDKPHNVCLVSTTGGGKSAQADLYGQDAMKDVGKGKDIRAFYYDDSGDGYEMLRQMKLSPHAIIHNLNPLDSRSKRWAMDLDFTTPAHALDLSTTLFYKGDHESSFYLEYSRGVLAKVIATLIATKKALKERGIEWRWGFTELSDVMSDPAKWERVLEATTEGRALLATVRGNDETFTNVKASIQRYMPHYRIIGALWDRATEEISFREWVKDTEGSILYVTRPNDSREAVEAINRVMFRSITYFALALPASDTRRIYFFLDELGNAPRWDGLESLALTGRKRGLVFIVGFQEIGSVEVKYEDAKTANQILAMCPYKWFGKIDDAQTQEWASKQIGQHKFTDPTRTEGHNQTGHSDSVSFGKKIEAAVLGANFGNFPVVNFKRGVGIWGWYLMPEPVGAFPHEIKVSELTKRLPPMRTDTVNFRPRPDDDQTPREWTDDETAAFWNAIEGTQGIPLSGADTPLSLEELAKAYKTREMTQREKARINGLSFLEKKRFYALANSSTQEMSLDSLAKELLTREPTPDEEARINALSDKEKERFFDIMHKEESKKHERATVDEPGQNNGKKYSTGKVQRKPRDHKSPPVQ